MDWELIEDMTGKGYLPDPYSHRMKIPGGWLVRTVKTMHAGCSVHTVFVSDPNHEWKLECPTTP